MLSLRWPSSLRYMPPARHRCAHCTHDTIAELRARSGRYVRSLLGPRTAASREGLSTVITVTDEPVPTEREGEGGNHATGAANLALHFFRHQGRSELTPTCLAKERCNRGSACSPQRRSSRLSDLARRRRLVRPPTTREEPVRRISRKVSVSWDGTPHLCRSLVR